MKDVMDNLEYLIPTPDHSTAQLAFDFAQFAKADAEASNLLSKRYFLQSLYLLQQSAEKSSKSVGLILRTVRPDELVSKVSHDSVRALLVHSSEVLKLVEKRVSTVLASNSTTNSQDLQDLFGKLLSLLPSEETLIRIEEKIRNANESEMWAATLNLDTSVDLVRHAMAFLKASTAMDKLRFRLRLKLSLSALKLLGHDLGDYADYYYGLMRALIRAYPLSMLTMWHATTTRYPPTNGSYWNWEAYDRNAKLIRSLPRLQSHARIMADSVLLSARAATRLANSRI